MILYKAIENDNRFETASQQLICNFIWGFQRNGQLFYANDKYIASILSLSEYEVDIQIQKLIKNKVLIKEFYEGNRILLLTWQN